MNPLAIFALLVPVLSVSPLSRQLQLQQSQLTCASLSTKQPNHCIAPGRVVEAWVSKQGSSGKCRVYSTFGFIENYLWVRAGCGGTFDIVYEPNEQYDNTPQGCQQGEVSRVCFDTSPGTTVCRVPLLITEVNVRQQFNNLPTTNAACQKNYGYGISRNQSAIWTNRGCQGTFDVKFQICPMTSQFGCRTFTSSLQCGNGGFMPTECSVPVEVTSVRLEQSIIPASNACVENVGYGQLPDGVWVAQGCRGSFALNYRVCTGMAGYQSQLPG